MHSFADVDVLAVLPMQTFWSRLAGKYGNKFFWQERGEEAAIVNAVRRLPCPVGAAAAWRTSVRSGYIVLRSLSDLSHCSVDLLACRCLLIAT